MPILTEPESNPRWGFLHGLGVASPAVVPPTDQFTGWPSLAAKRAAQGEIKKAILAADEAIYGAAKDMPGVWSSLKSIGLAALLGPAGMFGAALTKLLAADTQERIKQSVVDRAYQWEAAKKTLWEVANFGTITADNVTRSVTPDEMRRLLGVIGKSVANMKDAVQLANDTTVSALITTSLRKTVEGVIEGFKRAGDVVITALAAIESILKGTFEAAKKAGDWLEYLPYIVVGAIVLPFAFRAFTAYKKGGASGAAEYAAGAIESGRGKAWEGTKRAGSAAARAAKAGAALYTGNPAIAMSGLSRRRRRRR